MTDRHAAYLRIRYRELGGHVHCRVFSHIHGTFGLAGELVFSVEEWPDIVALFSRGPGTIEFLLDDLGGEPSITCPRCGATSYHPKDIDEGYCGHCHDWTRAR